MKVKTATSPEHVSGRPPDSQLPTTSIIAAKLNQHVDEYTENHLADLSLVINQRLTART